jgi:hypothetical protein
LDSVSVRVDELVKDLRPPKAAALRAVLDKFINTNNRPPSDQGQNRSATNVLVQIDGHGLEVPIAFAALDQRFPQ